MPLSTKTFARMGFSSAQEGTVVKREFGLFTPLVCVEGTNKWYI